MGFSLRPAGVVGSVGPAVGVGMFIAFGGFLFGYDTGTISGILNMNYWLRTFTTETRDGAPYLTASQESEIVSLLSAGTFFGALGSAPLADAIGRRWGLVGSCIVFIFGVILQTASSAIPLFVAGRFFAGFGVGLLSAIVPLYQSETAPKWIRGTIVGSYQLAITIGLLIAACVNYGTQDRNDSGSYRIPIALQFAWGLILIAGMIALPETPRFLIKKDRMDQAAKSLSRLRKLPTNDIHLQDEMAEIKANYEYELSMGKASYLDCFKGNLGKRLATGCLLQALQQLTGVNFIFYYGTVFFESTNAFSNAFIITVITDVVNVGSTFPGLYAVEKLGRRNTLLGGAVGMAICQFIVAILGTIYIKQDATGANYTTNTAAAKALIAFVCFYIFFFASTWGPNAWVVTGEIFPLKARAKCLSMTTATNWLLNWAIAFATPYLVNYGPGNANLQAKVFFLWGGFCAICAFFVWALIYETKGLSLEQVDELYAKVPHAWQSKNFRPSVRFTDVQEFAPNEGRGRSLAEVEKDAVRNKSVVHEAPIQKEY